MNVKALLGTAAFFFVAAASAQAQAPKDDQGLRDILNRAQSQSDRKAVEDLIGKLGGSAPGRPASPTTPPPSATVATPPSTPATPATAGVPSDRATPAPSAATASTPPPSAQDGIAAAPKDGSRSPAAVTPPPAASRASAPPTPSFGPAATGTAAPNSEAATAASAPPPPARPSSPVAPSTPPSAPATAAAPPAPPAATTQPAPTPVSAPAADAPVGSPIGPAEALPRPIGPSDADMARAPDVAREMGLPNVDIEVLFGYDSSEIAQETAESLMNLGRALTDPRLAGQRFVIAGHTDARGTRAYNEALSDRRARAVRQYLIEQFKIAPDRLVARGFGETQLKNARNPSGPENRRVQVINWTGQTAVRNGR